MSGPSAPSRTASPAETALDPRQLHRQVEEALDGVDLATGVPCSLLGSWLDLLDESVPTHVRATNEGEAVSIAVGHRLGGGHPVVYLQNSGLGNAINPLASMAATFAVPLLLVIGYRGDPGPSGEPVELDEPQHRLMGAATVPILSAVGIESAVIDAGNLEATAARTRTGLAEGRSQAWLVSKGTLPRSSQKTDDRPLPTRREYVELVAGLRRDRGPGSESADDLSIITTTGMTGRELESIDARDQDLYMVGSMGCASSLGLGVALSRQSGASRASRRLVILDGDGAVLMRLENLLGLAHYTRLTDRDPIVHVVVDNGSYDSTGAQTSLSAQADLAAVAEGLGYRSVARAESLPEARAVLERLLADRRPGAHLCLLRARSGSAAPVGRPALPPEEQARRFARSLAR